MSSLSALYSGQVYHRRSRPQVHTLRYRVFSLLLDLREIDTLSARLWLFSRNRRNLVSFHDADFGDGRDESLSDCLHRRLHQAGETRVPVRILVSFYPRVFGYAFNPLTVFYCLDATGDVFAVVHEVHNTFGERHAYVLPVQTGNMSDGRWIHQQADKALFVSPFAHMCMRYEFRLNVPGERQIVVIRVFDDKGQWLTASYTASREPLTARCLLKHVLLQPCLTFKVTAGIHWEAFRLWLKGVPWFTHIPKDDVRITGRK